MTESLPEFAVERALELAAMAADAGEVPVGAVVVCNGQIVGEAGNHSIARHDPTGHAELLALRQAGATLGNYRLVDCILYCTLEPCMMCVGAMVHARVARLVFGAVEPKAGGVCTHPLADSDWLNHQLAWEQGPGEAQAGALMSAFFKARRTGNHWRDLI